jgi:cytochrome c oxidase subunit 4
MGHSGAPTVEETEAAELAHHPEPIVYVKVAVVLTVVTAIEVAIYYVSAIRDVLVPSLLALAAIKFALVVLWFMHLRFDSKIFRRLFVFGLVLAILVFGVVLWNFFARGGPAPGPPG